MTGAIWRALQERADIDEVGCGESQCKSNSGHLDPNRETPSSNQHYRPLREAAGRVNL